MQLFIGLGNPDAKYAKNRHNIGFMVVDALAEAYSFEPFKAKYHGLLAEGRIGSEKVLLLKPQTFMNKSGSGWCSVKFCFNYIRCFTPRQFTRDFACPSTINERTIKNWTEYR